MDSGLASYPTVLFSERMGESRSQQGTVQGATGCQLSLNPALLKDFMFFPVHHIGSLLLDGSW